MSTDAQFRATITRSFIPAEQRRAEFYVYDCARFRSRKSVALQDAAQPIVADCILRGRRKSTAGKKRETRRIKGHADGGRIRGGEREMPINESASAKTRLVARRSSRTTKTTSRGEEESDRGGGVTHLP